MAQTKSAVLINNELSDPLGDYVIDYLLSQTKETTFHDFKWTIDVSKDSPDFPKIIKDVYAFTNYGGGFLVLGVKQNDHSNPDIKGSFVKTGLPEGFEIDQSTLQEKINSFMDLPITVGYTQFYREVYGETRKFALIYIPPSPKIMIPKKHGEYKIDGKVRNAFVKGAIYTRRGTASVQASDYEVSQIKKRVKNEQYRLSILSGEPDKVTEKLYGNLFEIKNIPQFVYVGNGRFDSYSKVIEELQKKYPERRSFSLKYRPYEEKIVSFQNLKNPSNINSELVYHDEVYLEETKNWLEDKDKERIIISLLNKEVADAGRRVGMRFDGKTAKLFYPTDEPVRSESWPTRYKGEQQKQVAKRIWAEQLHRHVFAHAAVRPTVMRIGQKFYLRLNLTMIITEDGRVPMLGQQEGTIITRSSYRKYNKQQLNNILFWINKLGDGNVVFVLKDFIISNEPVQTTADTGILWDMPTMDLKQIIEDYKPEDEMDEEEIDEVGEPSYEY